MSKKNLSRRYSVLAAACALGAAGSVFGAEGAPIVFTPPAATPLGGNGTIGVYEVTSNGAINDQDAARASLLAPGVAAVKNAYTTTRVNFGPNDGHFFASNAGGNVANENFKAPGDNISWVAQGNINIPVAGTYTFGVNSDDGFTLAFPGKAFAAVTLPSTDVNGPAKLQTYNGVANGAFQFFGGRGNNDSLASINLPAGAVPFTLTFHQGGGGYGVELFAAPGTKAAFDNSFNLVGQGAIPAAPKITEKRSQGLGGLTVSPFTYTEIHSNTGTVTQLLTAFGNGQGTTSQQTVINFTDLTPAGFENSGGHTPKVDFPNGTPADDNNFGAYAKATLTVDAAHAGKYTFVAYTDDGYLVDIRNSSNQLVDFTRSENSDVANRDSIGGNDSLFHDTNCCADRLGVWNLTEGTYTLETAFNEGGGGSGFFLYGAQGDVPLRQADGTFNPQFVLVGDGTTGQVDFVTQDSQTARAAGLQFVDVPEPTSIALLGLGGIAVLARRRRNA